MTTTRTTARRTALAAAVAVAGFGGLALPATSSARCSSGDPDIPCPTTTVKKTAKGVVAVNPRTTLGVRAIPFASAYQIRQLKNGAKVTIVCQIRADKVSGTFGTTRLWNKLKNGGYVSDAYVNTGSDGRVAPRC